MNADAQTPHGARLAIIGGSGLTRMDGLRIERREMVKTPYGAPSCPLVHGFLGDTPVVFLARHGSAERIPPHRINYCANVWALQSVGITHVFATSAVGGIDPSCTTGAVVVPDQLIDYTQGRENSFSDASADAWRQVDFTQPYDDALRAHLLAGARRVDGLDVIDGGCYAARQGPRFETAAEVRKLKGEGNSIVGLTGMPEAGLARELGIGYACCAVVVNPAAGTTAGGIDVAALRQATEQGMRSARAVLLNAAAAYGAAR